jgi:predicted alpha/beta hydrolase family esterase
MAPALSGFDVLVLPGRGNSGPEHWQTHWLGLLPNASRVLQASWGIPDPEDWVRRVDAAVALAPHPVVLVGHSLGTVAAVKWATAAVPEQRAKARAAFLVAPTDVATPDHIL